MRRSIYKTKDLYVVVLAQQFGDNLKSFRVINGYYIAKDVSKEKMSIISHCNKLVAKKDQEINEKDQIFVFSKNKSSIYFDNEKITLEEIKKFESETEQEDELSIIMKQSTEELNK